MKVILNYLLLLTLKKENGHLTFTALVCREFMNVSNKLECFRRTRKNRFDPIICYNNQGAKASAATVNVSSFFAP